MYEHKCAFFFAFAWYIDFILTDVSLDVSIQLGKLKWLSSILAGHTRQDHPPELIEMRGNRGLSSIDAIYNDERARKAEMPSANGHASARGKQMTSEVMR